MAQNFSTAEAQKTIQEHKKLLETLAKASGAYDASAAKVKTLFGQLTSREKFSETAQSELISGSESERNRMAFGPLVRELYFCRETVSHAESAKTLLDAKKSEIEENITALEREENGIKRLFSSSDQREKGRQAYDLLSDLLRGSYGTRAKNIGVKMSDAAGITQSDAWKEFELDRGSFYDTLLTIVPDADSRETGVKEAQKLLEDAKAITKPLENSRKYEKSLRNVIIECGENLARAETMKTLAEVPVEELNRGESHFKVSLLRDDHIENVAQVVNKSVYALAAIKGISDTSAGAMKKRAQELYNESAKTSKIRLSADDKSEEATALVIAVFKYRRIAEDIKEADALSQRDDMYEAEQAADVLENAAAPVGWFFCTRSAKEDASRAYFSLKDTVKGPLLQTANDLEEQLEAHMRGNALAAWKDFTENSVDYITCIEEIAPGLLGGENKVYGLPEEIAEGVKTEDISGSGLKCKLRRYQEWGVKYALHQKRVLLGDDMGLGKTVQAIATMVSLRNTGETHFAVVCPASVITNWSREIEKHSDLKPVVIHGDGKEEALAGWIASGGVAITTYESTSAFKLDENFKFSMLVVDEAHYIKNPAAQRTARVKELCTHADRLLFMTGTALENNVDEMLNIVSILQPDTAKTLESKAFMSSSDKFKDEATAVYYRRKRSDVLSELPEKTEKEEWCKLGKEEKNLYESTVIDKNFAAIRRVSWNIGDPEKSCKAQRLKEIVAEAESEDRRVIVFSFFLSTIKMVSEMFAGKCMPIINGSVQPARRQEIIDEFGKSPAGTVLPAQIQAGGTGLNIQAASVIVLCEPQLKPSLETQAIARAYRMGQARNVLVYRLLCTGTVDEKITELLSSKQKIFDTFADDSKAADENLTMDKESGIDYTGVFVSQILEEEIKRILSERK